ncbi:MAG: phosphotransferase [Thermodesulfovibrionales bacterium]
MKKINAFVLAAGYGERLRPLTDLIPKPLLPILGRPAIERVIEKISRLPLGKIGINSHYKGELIRQWAEGSRYSEKIMLYHEESILGTGGAVRNASRMLQDSEFLLHNADIISDIDIGLLLEHHMTSDNLVTLAVHDHPEHSNVWIDEQRQLRYVGREHPEKVTGLFRTAFTGIAVYSPEFLRFLPKGPSNIVDAWLSSASTGKKIGTLDVTGCYWSDIGNPSAYTDAVFAALRSEGESIYIDPSADCGRLDIGALTVIEKDCIFEGPASISRSILLPGTVVKEKAVLKDCIMAGPDLILNIPESKGDHSLSAKYVNSLILNVNFTETPDISLIGHGGSDRTYFRVSSGEKRAVLMQTTEADPDFERQVAYSGFLRRFNIPVPELIAVDHERREALFEDLGDISLYSWLKFRKEPSAIEKIYQRVLDILINLHTGLTDDLHECPLLQSRIFDHCHLRWETDYFATHFLNGLMGMDVSGHVPLKEDFERLATRVDSFRKTVIHRDFQSQNIMVTPGDRPRLIDYQGARIGPAAYDLASILFDPYCRLQDDMRARLLDHYVTKRQDQAGRSFDAEEFMKTIVPCSLQRHMQALGAYGFLSRQKGKTYFLKYLPQALAYLKEEIQQERAEYPALYDLLMRFHEKA